MRLNRLGLHVVGLVMALVFLLRIKWGALLIMGASQRRVKRTGTTGSNYRRSLGNCELVLLWRSVQGLAHLDKSR